MNILGEGFPESIIKQIAQRQKTYGAGYAAGTSRSNDQLVYLNSNTSWVKLVSSVNIDDPKIIQDKSLAILGNDISGNKLATKFVLFNGVTDAETNKQRAGITSNKDLLGNNNAYGIGGTEFGIRPMMGIKSANIKHENRGSIRRATIQLKAFNKVQFDIIDVLYLRLGFNVLLEWGHSMYFNNKGVLQTKQYNSLAPEFLSGRGKTTYTPGSDGNIVEGTTATTSNLTYEEFLNLIAEKRLTSLGNYDAMFAKVSNFHWSFLPDGSYDITIDLISIGDIVESFKINALVDGITFNAASTGSLDLTEASDADVITNYANKNTIGQYFYSLITNPQNNLIAQKRLNNIKAATRKYTPGASVDSNGVVGLGSEIGKI